MGGSYEPKGGGVGAGLSSC